jgi:outer membrane lipoprotein LolB
MAAWAAAMLMGGCAVTAPPAAPGGAGPLSGRLSVQVEGSDGAAPRSMSAAFELQGDGQAGQLELTTPLGSVVAQARWSLDQVTLATPQGSARFASLDDMTREVLGVAVPVAALFDWLRGRPWPGAASTPTAPPAEPGFRQLGWTVNLAKFDQAWVAALRERPPTVTVRAKLDRP